MTAPYYPPGSGTAGASDYAHRALDRFIAEWQAIKDSGKIPPHQMGVLPEDLDKKKAMQQQTLAMMASSGIMDTLQGIVGKHQLTTAPRAPRGFFTSDPWGNAYETTLAVNTGGGHIVFNPDELTKANEDVAFGKEQTQKLGPHAAEAGNVAYLKTLPTSLDDPQLQLMQTLAHEIGHTAASMPGLFVDSTDYYGRSRDNPKVERGNALGFGDKPKMVYPMSLYQQWQGEVAKNPALYPDIKEGLGGTGWHDSKGDFRPGGPELFADSFSEAVTLLRTSWDPKDARQVVKNIPGLERANPGLAYLLKWFTTQPAYEQHPIGKILKLVQPVGTVSR